MKRPSEVPPDVDNSVSIPSFDFIAAMAASINSPLLVKKGKPESTQSIL